MRNFIQIMSNKEFLRAAKLIYLPLYKIFLHKKKIYIYSFTAKHIHNSNNTQH